MAELSTREAFVVVYAEKEEQKEQYGPYIEGMGEAASREVIAEVHAKAHTSLAVPRMALVGACITCGGCPATTIHCRRDSRCGPQRRQ
jgi:hypothetical protein